MLPAAGSRSRRRWPRAARLRAISGGSSAHPPRQLRVCAQQRFAQPLLVEDVDERRVGIVLGGACDEDIHLARRLRTKKRIGGGGRNRNQDGGFGYRRLLNDNGREGWRFGGHRRSSAGHGTDDAIIEEVRGVSQRVDLGSRGGGLTRIA